MERRKHARFFACLEIEIKELGNSNPARGATTDVSLGGCYIATIFPFAVGSQVHFVMQVAGEAVRGLGTVQTCHPGVGMGIRFIDLADQDKNRLDRYLRGSLLDTHARSNEEICIR